MHQLNIPCFNFFHSLSKILHVVFFHIFVDFSQPFTLAFFKEVLGARVLYGSKSESFWRIY